MTEMDTNGWELDFWIMMFHEDLPNILVAGTGLTLNLEGRGRTNKCLLILLL